VKNRPITQALRRLDQHRETPDACRVVAWRKTQKRRCGMLGNARPALAAPPPDRERHIYDFFTIHKNLSRFMKNSCKLVLIDFMGR
jgi:hypothetical protein